MVDRVDVEEKQTFSRQAHAKISEDDRVKLIRRANLLFNQGRIKEAERIFLTVHYMDGLRRLGDYYKDQKDFIQALKMYKRACSNFSTNELAQEMAQVLRLWMS